MKHVLMTAAAAATLATGALAQEITLGRFFGACEDAGTDTTTSVGEACIIQSIINAADAEIEGVTVDTLPTDWGNYYDQIKAAFAGGTPPDVFVMHRHRIPEFAGLGAVAELSGDLESVGIDPSDWSDSAVEAVSYEGGIYGVPMDFHANLWHVNMDLMAEAGLVENGEPVLPSSPEELLEHASPEELLEHAQMVKDATGQDYLAADFAQFPIGVRVVLALMWQQDANIFTEDGTATIETPEARDAVTAITQLFDAGLANPQLNYADSQQAFLNGEAAILVNGTWVVDFYAAEAAKEDVALDNYYVADFPTLFETTITMSPTSRRCSKRVRPGPTATCGRSPRRSRETRRRPRSRFWPSSTNTTSTGRAPATWRFGSRSSKVPPTSPCPIATSTPAPPPSPATPRPRSAMARSRMCSTASFRRSG